MSLHFDNELIGQVEYAVKAFRRFKWFQGEEEVRQSMTPAQSPIYYPAIAAVGEILLSRLKGEVTPNDGPWRQEATEKDVGTKVHVVVTVKAFRYPPIETSKFIKLSPHDVFEGGNQAGMKQNLREAVPKQVL
jgi:hypothetical protein